MAKPYDRARGPALEEVREELKRMGYLSHRVERYLLQDALRPERPLATVLGLAGKLGILGGMVVALAAALWLAAWNPWIFTDPLDLVPLFLHLLPLGAVAVGGAFLVLAGVLTLVLVAYPAFRLDTVSFVVAAVGGALMLAPALFAGWELVSPAAPGELALVAGGAALGVFAVGRLFYHALLALAIRITDRAPRRRGLAGRWLVAGAVGFALLLVLVPAMRAQGGGGTLEPAALPSGKVGRVLLVGVDGVLPGELEYLLARGRLPQLGRLAAEGALLTYRRAVEEPAVFWTTVATGVPSTVHGVAAVDSFRPRGMRNALSVSGGLRWYWQAVGQPLGLVVHRPILSNRRRAHTVWELAARGGRPVLAVDWWSTWPAEPLPGLVVAHGAYQLLGAEGAVAPPAREEEVRRLAPAELGPTAPILAAAFAPERAEELAARALRPEVFYRAVFAHGLDEVAPVAAALYLPALDLAADGWTGGDVAFADLVAAELGALDTLLGATLADGRWDAVAVVADPGRRGDTEGRVVLWRPGGCPGSSPAEIEPTAVPAALLRVLGLPQSAELPEPPAACSWPDPPVTVKTFGDRQAPPPEGASDEYLENLRSLGYL